MYLSLLSPPCLGQQVSSSEPSGLNHLPLFLDGAQIATLSVQQDENGIKANTQQAITALKPILLPEALGLLEGLLEDDAWWPVNTPHAGVEIAYDPQNVALILNAPRFVRNPTRYSASPPSSAPLGRLVSPSPLSAYLNIYAAQNHLSGFGADDGRQPLRLDFDGAINLRGWVLESQAGYTEDAANPLTLRNTRLVHDDTQNLIRYQVGELSYPTSGFQGFTQLLGVGMARNFLLQPYRVTQPVGQTRFVLESPATVDVLVNDVKVKSLQLPAGTYQLSDFPVISGANNVRLIITDNAGRVEEKDLSILTDGTLLKAGLAEFTANAGVPVDPLSTSRAYQTNKPQISALLRYGLTDTYTAGVNIQGGAEQQLFGLGQTLAGPLGLFHLESALSRARGQGGLADNWDGGARLEYRLLTDNARPNDLPPDAWQAAVEYQGSAFNVPAGQTNTSGLQLQSSYNHAFTEKLSLLFGSSYRFASGSVEDDYRTNLTFSYRPRSNWVITIDNAISLRDHFSVLANITWFPWRSNEVASAGYDSQSRTLRSSYTRYRAANTGWDTGLEVEHTPYGENIGGNLGYTGIRGTARLQSERRTTLDGKAGTSTQVNLATAVAYAGGNVALSHPINNSFAIVVPVKGTTRGRLLLNPNTLDDGETTDEGHSGPFGPAVLTDLSPYTYRYVQANIANASTPERDNFVLFPSYKSGTRVRVGRPHLAEVEGYLDDADDKPLSYIAANVNTQRGSRAAAVVDDSDIEPAAGPIDLPFTFTNKDGFFHIDDLPPGTYRLAMPDNDQGTFEFTVPEHVSGTIDLGHRRLNVRAGHQSAAAEAVP